MYRIVSPPPPPNSCIETPTPSVTVGPIEEVTKLNEVIRVRLPCSRASTLLRRDTRASLYLLQLRAQKAAVCKPRKEPSSRTELAGTLILDFLSFRTMRNKFLLPVVFCYSIPSRQYRGGNLKDRCKVFYSVLPNSELRLKSLKTLLAELTTLRHLVQRL